jgi:4-amino-4-deoxy-L-arabinose transferase-like glycosyltransferase
VCTVLSDSTASPDYIRARQSLLLLIAAHVITMTLFATLARLPEPVWDDMLEAWAWGQQFQLGYYKHPPLSAWIAGLWFKILPRTDASYYALSALNIGAGLVGVWRLSRLLLRSYARLSAVSLLLFTPSYHYMGTNFNANTILLSIWPWTAYYFVKTLHTNAWKDGIAFGVLCGWALLGKYYSILLLLSCFFAALLHPRRRAYFGSAAPYCAAAVCAAVVAPHAWWAFQAGLPTVDYALAKSGHCLLLRFDCERAARPISQNTYSAVTTGLVAIAVNALGTAILLTALGRRSTVLVRRVWHFWKSPQNAWLMMLGFGPIVATLVLGIAGYVKVAPNYLIPTVYILPLLVLIAVGPALTPRRVRGIMITAALFMVFTLTISPIVAYASMVLRVSDRKLISPDVATVATELWHEEVKAPVRIAAGSEAFSLALPFYSADGPNEFTHFNVQQAPWITPERIAREGMLCVCAATDVACLQQTKRYELPETKRWLRVFQKSFRGVHGTPIEVVIIMVPPRRI